MSGLHSVLPPSDGANWLECTAKPQMALRFPALTVDPSAAEGEAAHWAAYSMMRTHVPQVGEVAPNGVILSQEMLDSAQVYVNHVYSVANKYGKWGQQNCETRRAMPSLHPEMFGTCDADLDLLIECKEVHFWDLKHGFLDVEVYQCVQLAIYARGWLDERGYDGHAEQNIWFVFHIVQPRSFHPDGPVRTWRVLAADLRAMWNRIRAAAYEAMSDDPKYKVGNQCTYCEARRACPALRRASHAAQQYAESAMPVELDGIALGIELHNARRMLELLQSRIGAMEEQAEQQLRRGEVVLHHQMSPGRGATKWSKPAEDVIALGNLLGLKLAKPAEPITVNQAREVFRKSGVDDKVIDGYSQRIPGAMKLTAIADNSAAKVFMQNH